ncbi:hypothetical protein ElyMa_002285700 [Elysia marginata]|uniref:Uncharacterized protein n=1 Tax=Elysia marginata TaxID=1093978 RepID=A0AAV4G2T2_9GAST|nr:hypothetical protein ElyMa_002285700 [Elysia marginata]
MFKQIFIENRENKEDGSLAGSKELSPGSSEKKTDVSRYTPGSQGNSNLGPLPSGKSLAKTGISGTSQESHWSDMSFESWMTEF